MDALPFVSNKRECKSPDAADVSRTSLLHLKEFLAQHRLPHTEYGSWNYQDIEIFKPIRSSCQHKDMLFVRIVYYSIISDTFFISSTNHNVDMSNERVKFHSYTSLISMSSCTEPSSVGKLKQDCKSQ